MIILRIIWAVVWLLMAFIEALACYACAAGYSPDEVPWVVFFAITTMCSLATAAQAFKENRNGSRKGKNVVRR